MSATAGVSLQINLAPTDLPTARHTVPHQLRQWAGQVDEVLLTLDLHRSRGRYSAAFEERLPGMRQFLADLCAEYPHARVHDVDYSEETRATLAEKYFGGQPYPDKDWNGGPFHSYLAGLDGAAYDYVLHMDSDMMYGGGSQTWIAEAIQLMRDNTNVIACNPLPGPPTSDGALRSQMLDPFPYSSFAYSVAAVSTRIFFLDRARFRRMIPVLPALPALTLRREWQARFDGNPPYAAFEDVVSSAMAERGVVRVDFLGEAPGMWSLHPPYRSAEFFERLPELITQVEASDVPEGQRGMHDMDDSMIDWSAARAPRWRRVAKHVRLALSRPFAEAGQANGRPERAQS